MRRSAGCPVALDATDRVPLADPAAVGVNFTVAVQDPPAAMVVPQVLVWLNGPVTATEETVAAVVPGLVTVTVWDGLVDPVTVLGNETLDGDAVRALLPLVDPPPEKTSSSDSWAAVQPVLAVKLSCTYWSLVPAGSGMVTVLPVDGLKVYPAEATIWLNVVPLVLPRTDRVSVRVAQAVAGGRSRVIDPMGEAEPG